MSTNPHLDEEGNWVEYPSPGSKTKARVQEARERFDTLLAELDPEVQEVVLLTAISYARHQRAHHPPTVVPGGSSLPFTGTTVRLPSKEEQIARGKASLDEAISRANEIAAGLRTVYDCPTCQAPHEVTLIMESGGGLFYTCPENGRQRLAPHQQMQLKPSSSVDVSHLRPKPEDSFCARCGWHVGRHFDASNGGVPWLWCPKPDGSLPDVTVNNTRTITPVAPHGVWKSP